jgi:hypothetical protein
VPVFIIYFPACAALPDDLQYSKAEAVAGFMSAIGVAESVLVPIPK